ncbi:MAG: SsrA-binding protein [Elusimicrobia bacterium CG02_land_8_20_14_3_00_37_13]|nr:MAG: SsrA-binding protein [Elusimicrobia bacterium CG02_land_8_20_14_3_00_37_13]
MAEDNKRVVVRNRGVFHEYSITEIYNAGIVLKGSEVKSLRQSRASLKDSYCKIEGGEIFIYNLYISPYEQSKAFTPNPKRKRKLLLHKQEINRLIGRTTQRGLALVPVEIYFEKSQYAKVAVGLAKKKKSYDKREAIKLRDIEREIRGVRGV